MMMALPAAPARGRGPQPDREGRGVSGSGRTWARILRRAVDAATLSMPPAGCALTRRSLRRDGSGHHDASVHRRVDGFGDVATRPGVRADDWLAGPNPRTPEGVGTL